MLRITSASILLVTLIACSSEPQPVSYYKVNVAERTQVLVECSDDVQRASTDGDCLNAAAALDEEHMAAGQALAAKSAARLRSGAARQLEELRCRNSETCTSTAEK